jgi:hypothetical protein
MLADARAMKTYVSFDTALELAVAILEPAARPGDGYLCSLDDDARAEAFAKIDEADLRVDRLLRDAVAGRHLLAWVEKDGALIEAVDPDLTMQGQNVLFGRNDLEVWLSSFKGETRRRGRSPAVDWETIKDLLHAECKKHHGVPGLENGVGWKNQAAAENFVTDALSLRGESAAESTVRAHVAEMLRDYKAAEGR